MKCKKCGKYAPRGWIGWTRSGFCPEHEPKEIITSEGLACPHGHIKKACDICPTFTDFSSCYGDLMTVEEFMEAVKSGSFIDYDGSGVWSTKQKMSNLRVRPSDTKKPDFSKPEWATHVMWFNR